MHVPLPGDATSDDRVNLLDFNALAANFNKFGRGDPTGDFNFDGIVNLLDFNILASRFNTVLTAGGPGVGRAKFGSDRILDVLRPDVLA